MSILLASNLLEAQTVVTRSYLVTHDRPLRITAVIDDEEQLDATKTLVFGIQSAPDVPGFSDDHALWHDDLIMTWRGYAQAPKAGLPDRNPRVTLKWPDLLGKRIRAVLTTPGPLHVGCEIGD